MVATGHAERELYMDDMNLPVHSSKGCKVQTMLWTLFSICQFLLNASIRGRWEGKEHGHLTKKGNEPIFTRNPTTPNPLIHLPTKAERSWLLTNMVALRIRFSTHVSNQNDWLLFLCVSSISVGPDFFFKRNQSHQVPSQFLT